MAADTEFKGTYRLFRQTLSGARVPITGDIPHVSLDQTTPDKAYYFNGGAPANSGVTATNRAVLYPGERLVMQLKASNGGVGFDSTGGASEDIRVGLARRDRNSGDLVKGVITDADRSTTLLADDPTATTGQYVDVMHWVVPNGENWQLWGEWKVRSSSTA